MRCFRGTREPVGWRRDVWRARTPDRGGGADNESQGEGSAGDRGRAGLQGAVCWHLRSGELGLIWESALGRGSECLLRRRTRSWWGRQAGPGRRWSPLLQEVGGRSLRTSGRTSTGVRSGSSPVAVSRETPQDRRSVEPRSPHWASGRQKGRTRGVGTVLPDAPAYRQRVGGDSAWAEDLPRPLSPLASSGVVSGRGMDDDGSEVGGEKDRTNGHGPVRGRSFHVERRVGTHDGGAGHSDRGWSSTRWRRARPDRELIVLAIPIGEEPVENLGYGGWGRASTEERQRRLRRVSRETLGRCLTPERWDGRMGA